MGANTFSVQSSNEPQAGFSLIEVLVSFTILLIVLASVFELRLNSIRRIEDTGTRNQIEDLIRVDIALLRKKALQWQCQQGASCTGSMQGQYQPARYVSSHCSKATSNQINQFLADEEIENKTIINSDQNIEVSRTININGKQLDIAYLGNAGEQTISKSISITPQAMRWCS
jgi:prepilin-type N-terminal cleavage/methylation domain-containing protein